MGKPIVYAGKGAWMVNSKLPEQIAKKFYAKLVQRGCTCAELVRIAITDYVGRSEDRP